MRILMLAITVLLVSACGSGKPDAAPVASSSDAVAPAQPVPIRSGNPAKPPSPASTPAFVDKVWHVAPASAQEPGTTYIFLGNGVLVIDSPHGTPMRGRWSYVDGALTMTEEGVTYHDGPGLAMTTDLAEIVDRIITLGFTLNPEVARDIPREEWGIPGLAGRPLPEVRIIRDTARRLIEKLVARLDTEAVVR